MSNLTITHAGTTQTATSGTELHGGKLVRITPTISATAYDAGDVVFLTTEIPNAVSSRGGVSKLVGITMISQHDDIDDLALIFMQVSTNLIGALSPGSTGGAAMTDSQIEAANIIGHVYIDGSDGSRDLGGGAVYSTAASGVPVSLSFQPLLVQAASNSTSIYVAGVAADAQDYDAVDDLDLVFHFEYL